MKKGCKLQIVFSSKFLFKTQGLVTYRGRGGLNQVFTTSLGKRGLASSKVNMQININSSNK
jgi:hypothetical protein